MSEKKSFWSTLQGVLTAVGGLIGTLAAVIAAFEAMGWIHHDDIDHDDGVRRIDLSGRVLSIEAPEWVQEPIIGSITFNKHEEITRTGELKAFLVVRTENWVNKHESRPKRLVTLGKDERLCGIEHADDSGTNYYLGFRAHCNDPNICRYYWEGRTLWVKVGDVKVVLAAKNRDCP